MVVNLKELVGERRLLSGVWFVDDEAYRREWGGDDTAQCCYFMLDGRIYRAQEDPEDGYRSSLSTLEVCNLLPVNVWTPSEEVNVEYRTQKTGKFGYSCELLVFISVVTGKLVLEIGTDNTDDFYPSCVLHFDPTGLSHNQPLIDLLGRQEGGR